MMALTATATKTTHEKILDILNMKGAFVLSISPHKPNIMYWVGEKKSIEIYSQ